MILALKYLGFQNALPRQASQFQQKEGRQIRAINMEQFIGGIFIPIWIALCLVCRASWSIALLGSLIILVVSVVSWRITK